MKVDTVASVSTPPGVGAIAVVRMSGPTAFEILESLVGREATMAPERVVTLMELRAPDDGTPIDRALVTRFVGPASYTGEDMVELSCHGGRLVPELVLEACLRAGARRAEPGEFTRRAYLHGKLDLIQVEAVADVIEARSRALHRAAMGQLDRGLSARVAGLREELVGLEALLAHHVDFPEEDDAPVPLDRIVRQAAGVEAGLAALLATAPEGELLREGALAVFAGRPNAGKSSLYNALLGEERAIVTEVAGTTRDALEATVQLGGFPFRLVDTAGLREAEGHIESLGIEVAKRYMERADVLVFCRPADEAPAAADEAFLREPRSVPVVVVETKGDIAVAGTMRGGSSVPDSVAGRFTVSALTGEGLDALREGLAGLVYAGMVGAGESPVVTRRRQADGLGRARDEVAAFAAGLNEGLPAEVAATHLRTAESALEELLGVISVEDVLDVVFRDFCVGK